MLKLTQKEKKQDGIFFTPKCIRDKLFKHLPVGFIDEVKNVLEPSAGSCEFVNDILNNVEKITAIEYNQKVFHSIIYDFPEFVHLIHDDFLTHDFKDEKFDLIIGNPPYYLVKKNTYTLDKTIFNGKVNVFCLFIYKSLGLLTENGILSFIVPTALLNTYSYDKFRRYIHDHYTILDIIPTNEYFNDTKQETLIFNVLNGPLRGNQFIFQHNDYLFFTYQKEYYTKMLKDKVFIKDLNVSVKTGTVVWNQHKDKLTDDDTKDLLIYDFNIIKGEIKLGSSGKKGQYIQNFSKEPFQPPVLLISRGNGNAKLRLKCTLLECPNRFFVENHLYVISGPVEILKRIQTQLKQPEIIEFLQYAVPNNCLTKNDIINLIPLNK